MHYECLLKDRKYILRKKHEVTKILNIEQGVNIFLTSRDSIKLIY